MTTDMPAVHTTTTTRRPSARQRMEPTRKIALAAGIAYLVTFAASTPQLTLFADVIADPAAYISNTGSNAAVQWGSVLEFLTAASGVATAVLLYPVTRRISRSAAIGFVASRVVEAALILVGVVAILSVITLQQHYRADGPPRCRRSPDLLTGGMATTPRTAQNRAEPRRTDDGAPRSAPASDR